MLTKSRRSTWDCLSTGDAASICRVAPRTVTKWFENPDVPLSGWKIPGGGERRIPIENMITFMRSTNIPIDWLRDWLEYRGCPAETIAELLPAE